MDLIEKQNEIERFWDDQPCDSDRSGSPPGTKEFFLEIECDRYRFQDHLPAEIFPAVDWRGKRVLEIGSGVGTDGRRLIKRGAIYTGINVDQASVDLTRRALELFGLTGRVEKVDATALPYENASFDIVYSYGALPSIPDLPRALAEAFRVLRPGGELIGMFYNKSSINYHIEIRFLRRLFRPLLVVPGAVALLSALGLRQDRLIGHRELYRKSKHLSAAEWITRNTDGPDNPFVNVQTKREVRRLLRRFEIASHKIYFFDYRHWGVLGRVMPKPLVRALSRRWGWHHVVRAVKPSGK